MTKTEHYQLNKPEASDPVRVADFNQNADIIDTVLANVAGRKRVVVGSYIGDNTGKHTIPLEFTPRFVLVMSRLNDKAYLTIATPELGGCIGSSSFGLSDSRCVENGFYIAGNANYSKEGNYYLAVE